LSAQAGADGQPRLPLFERAVGPQGGRRGDEAGLAHDDLGERALRGLQRRQPGLPVEAGRVRPQGGKRHERVGLLGVPVGDPIPGRGRQRRLQLHDLLGEALRVGQSHQLGEPGEVGDVGGADLGVRVVAVVRLVRQAQPGLAQVHQVAAGVLRVRADVGAEQRHATLALAAAEHSGERGPVRSRRDLVEQRLQRRDPELLDALDVHERRVQRGDPLRVGAVCVRRLLDDRAHVLLGAVPQVTEGAVLRAVRRDLVLAQVDAVEVGEQVVLGADGGVDPAQVEPGRCRGGHGLILPGGTDSLRGAGTPRPTTTRPACPGHCQ
jgi:hypothetical protein